MKVQSVRVRKLAFFFSYSAAAEGGFWGLLSACVRGVFELGARGIWRELGKAVECSGCFLPWALFSVQGGTHLCNVGQLHGRLVRLLAGARIAEARPPPLAVGPAGELDPALPSRHLVCLCVCVEVVVWRLVVSLSSHPSRSGGRSCRHSSAARSGGRIESARNAERSLSLLDTIDSWSSVGEQRPGFEKGGWRRRDSFRWSTGAGVGGSKENPRGRKVGEEIKPGSAKSRSDLG